MKWIWLAREDILPVIHDLSDLNIAVFQEHKFASLVQKPPESFDKQIDFLQAAFSSGGAWTEFVINWALENTKVLIILAQKQIIW